MCFRRRGTNPDARKEDLEKKALVFTWDSTGKKSSLIGRRLDGDAGLGAKPGLKHVLLMEKL